MQRIDHRVVGIDLGAVAALDEVPGGELEEVVGGVVGQADIERRVGLVQLDVGLDHEGGQRVDGQAAVAITPADGDRLDPAVVGRNALVELEVELGDELLGFRQRRPPRGEVGLQVWQQVAVEHPRPVATVGVLVHHSEVLQPEALHSLPERRRRPRRHARAEVGHLHELSPAPRVTFPFGFGAEVLDEARDPGVEALQRGQHSLVELNRLLVGGIGERLAEARGEPACPQLQHQRVVPTDVPGRGPVAKKGNVLVVVGDAFTGQAGCDA